MGSKWPGANFSRLAAFQPHLIIITRNTKLCANKHGENQLLFTSPLFVSDGRIIIAAISLELGGPQCPTT